MTSSKNGISNSQIIVRIPTATAPDDETVTTGETTLELALTRRYLEQLSCGATSDFDNSDSGEVEEDTNENASKDSGDSQQHRKPSRRRHRRASQRRKLTNWHRDQMPATAEGQQAQNQQLFKDARPRVATARLTRQVLQPDLMLSNCDPSTVAPAPGYFLLAPRLGERGLLEWRRRLWLQRQTEQRTDLGKLNENAKLRCQLGQQLAVTGECFQPRMGGAITSSDFASANVVEHQQEERDRQGYSQDATLTTRTSMASRPATAAVSSRNRQLPPQPRRIQQQQQHPAAKSNGHSTTDRKLLRLLNSHPPNQSTPPGSSHSFGRPRFSPYTPPLSSSMPITSRSARIRHATVSTDADITDPRIYPTELSSSRDQRQAQAAAMSRSYDCAFFSAGANSRGHGRRGEFIINPEWLSESVSIERLRINERPLIMPTGAQQQQQQLQHQHSVPSNWPKRCRSAPPPKQQQQPQNQHQSSINPITWQ